MNWAALVGVAVQLLSGVFEAVARGRKTKEQAMADMAPYLSGEQTKALMAALDDPALMAAYAAADAVLA